MDMFLKPKFFKNLLDFYFQYFFPTKSKVNKKKFVR